MPLLLTPLLVLVLLAALVVVVALSLHLRYRQGRALGWVLRINVWGLLSGRFCSSPLRDWPHATAGAETDTGWVQVVEAGGLCAVGGILPGDATACAWGLQRRRVASKRSQTGGADQ